MISYTIFLRIMFKIFLMSSCLWFASFNFLEHNNTIKIETIDQFKIDECSICLEKIGKEDIISCRGHKFHKTCISKWFETQKHSCPNCRTSFSVLIVAELLYESFTKKMNLNLLNNFEKINWLNQIMKTITEGYKNKLPWKDQYKLYQLQQKVKKNLEECTIKSIPILIKAFSYKIILFYNNYPNASLNIHEAMDMVKYGGKILKELKIEISRATIYKLPKIENHLKPLRELLYTFGKQMDKHTINGFIISINDMFQKVQEYKKITIIRLKQLTSLRFDVLHPWTINSYHLKRKLIYNSLSYWFRGISDLYQACELKKKIHEHVILSKSFYQLSNKFQGFDWYKDTKCSSLEFENMKLHKVQIQWLTLDKKWMQKIPKSLDNTSISLHSNNRRRSSQSNRFNDAQTITFHKNGMNFTYNNAIENNEMENIAMDEINLPHSVLVPT